MPLTAPLGYVQRQKSKGRSPAAEGAADLKARSRKERGVLEQWGMATAAGAQIKTTRPGQGAGTQS